MSTQTDQGVFNGGEPATDLASQAPEALEHFKASVAAGMPWHLALLESLALWRLPQEEYKGRTYRYLIQGEAFDWLLLAERMCDELGDVIPADEKERLLFYGELPETVEPDDFKDLLGNNKYRGYLNYWYGVVVEEALQLSVEEQVRKRHLALCYSDNEDLVEDAFIHLYRANRIELMEEFRRETHLSTRKPLNLADMKEFTYWLHKLRLNIWDPARVASDTKRGTSKLRALEQAVMKQQAPVEKALRPPA